MDGNKLPKFIKVKSTEINNTYVATFLTKGKYYLAFPHPKYPLSNYYILDSTGRIHGFFKHFFEKESNE